MIQAEKITTAVARGAWCNLCGTRLAGAHLPLRLGRLGRKCESANVNGAPPQAGRNPDNLGNADSPTWSICLPCYHERMRCASCGVMVGGQAFMLRGDPHFYCAPCFNTCPRCDTCDRPIGVGAQHAAPLQARNRHEGRRLCERCHSTAVNDPGMAYALYGRVKTALADGLGLSLREPCQLKLVSRRQLLHMVEESTLQNLDADSRGRCFGIFVRQGAHVAIFIEHGLPQIVLLEVMAHEHAHAWQSENSPINAPLILQEGFAEWVAYKLLQSWGCSRRSDRMLGRDDLYGRGLKLILDWEAAGGKAKVLQRITNY